LVFILFITETDAFQLLPQQEAYLVHEDGGEKDDYYQQTDIEKEGE